MGHDHAATRPTAPPRAGPPRRRARAWAPVAPHRHRPRPVGRLLPGRHRPAPPPPRGRRSPRWAPAARTCSSSSRSPTARPAGRHAGLYHFALLLPVAQELARALPAPRRDAHADRGRLRPRHLRGDLPARPRRQRHRARRRPPARAVADRSTTLGRPEAARPPRPARDASPTPSPSATPTPGRASATSTCTSATSRRAAASTATSSASSVMTALPSAVFVVGGRLPPPPRLQPLARPGVPRRPRRRRRSACATGRSCSTAPRELRRRARARPRRRRRRWPSARTACCVRDPSGIAVLAAVAPDAEQRSRAAVVTEQPSPYLLQLAKHFRHKLDVEFDERSARSRSRSGAASCAPGRRPGARGDRAERRAELERVEEVIAGHLERFGRRDELSVSWHAAALTAPGAATVGGQR